MNLKSKMIGSARPIPVWLWFFALFAIGSFVSLLMYLNLYEKGKGSGANPPSISSLFSSKESSGAGKGKPQAHKTPGKDSDEDSKNTRFDFYSLLPKMEVLVPESALSHRNDKDKETEKEKNKPSSSPASTSTTTSTTTATTTTTQPQTPVDRIKGNYFLQAGAFKDLQAADRMKANLGLLGIESKIESVKLDSGVWHRVRVGPFADLQNMNKTRHIMQSNSIKTIMVKVNS